MGVASDLNSLEKEYSETERNKAWKLLFTNLRDESDQLNIDLETTHALSPKNKTLNRYRDVLPYDHSRVKVSGIGESDYINANYVQLESLKDRRRYILTQGPLIGTLSHFWRMIWEQQSVCIIMLNKIVEKDMIKCAQYYPVSENELINHDYGDIKLSLSLVETIEHGAYVVRVLSLENKSTGESRRVFQYHYISWPDFGVPLSPVSFLQFLGDVRSLGALDDSEKPCVVHCSAGIGRSGTFVLIDLALFRMTHGEYTDCLDLKAMLMELRKCRMGLIQTAEQLRFAYLAIIVGTRAILNSTSVEEIKFDDMDSVAESETEEVSSSVMETDSDFSDDSEIMRSNSALDKAAAAVRTRRGIPLSKGFEDSKLEFNMSLPINNNATVNNNDDFDKKSSEIAEDRRRMIHDNRNRSRQKIDTAVSNEEDSNEMETAISKVSIVIVGASVAVGMLSLVCGLWFYKYTK